VVDRESVPAVAALSVQKRNTHHALRFEVKLEENLVRLHEEMEGRTDHPSCSVCFVVKWPKFWEVFAADFRDRVVHHG
jgi:RNA-directed DNA polymerase